MGGTPCDCEHDIVKLNDEVIDLLKEFASWGGADWGNRRSRQAMPPRLQACER